jgi:RNA polymerase sigma-70 factor (ECF subfamily)
MTPEEFGIAYGDGFSKTVRVLRCRGASLDQAEDVAQAAWLQGWRKLDQLRDETTVVGWVNMIAVNFYRRLGPKEARFQQLLEVELDGRAGIDSDSLDVAKILSVCKPRDRPLFQLQLRGLTTQEIASVQGVSGIAVRIRLVRARRSVRKNLEEAAAALREFYKNHAAAA